MLWITSTLLDIPMILFRRLFHSTLSYCLGGLFSVLSFFCTSPSPVFAASTPQPSINQPPILMLFGSNKAKTVAKDVEGKIQESIGLVTGDEGDRLAGKAKQAEANARDTADTLTSKAGMG
ncbi:CsbD family protein [Synechococcus sp. Ace-Pa]|uniref:CsbD family protein n=1 Tax=Synechococcus sp. Ace-Pa TaxID=2572902 RepID=UPI0021035E0E|nr:CsbD family protein [Synechococcus sp. Ace-Pa]